MLQKSEALPESELWVPTFQMDIPTYAQKVQKDTKKKYPNSCLCVGKLRWYNMV